MDDAEPGAGARDGFRPRFALQAAVRRASEPFVDEVGQGKEKAVSVFQDGNRGFWDITGCAHAPVEHDVFSGTTCFCGGGNQKGTGAFWRSAPRGRGFWAGRFL